MSSWHSYPSIFNLGHKAVKDLLLFPHVIEEKVDGSQFSFGLIEVTPEIVKEWREDNGVRPKPEYELKVRSKGAVMNVDAPEKMFSKAVATVIELKDKLHPGWTYRGEYLQKPKHNTLAYDRVPTGNVVIFDVSTGEEEWLGPEEKKAEATRLGLECVPTLLLSPRGNSTGLEQLRTIIDSTISTLGGTPIEGIVVKQLGPEFLYGQDKKTLIGKFVSERFKEAHVGAWKESNPTSGDVLVTLGHKYCTEGRWLKAIQHLREAGLLEDSPRDIGKLLIEVQKDLGKEEKEEIQKYLWRWANPHIMRASTRGFAEFYKDYLLKRQFENNPPEQGDTGGKDEGADISVGDHSGDGQVDDTAS